ncbi:hypothetical protein LA635_1141 [Erwinia amylovora LA635]|nr:hypothetical protein LA635_1141 [Erwinia amylovora LA635]CDK18133.1 hypothetical protein LA636_1141 [Erwinia amylovora LA636]CDK21502.1 hypothetical protein LA637_1142 [Erwinia amylovora LA637]
MATLNGKIPPASHLHAVINRKSSSVAINAGFLRGYYAHIMRSRSYRLNFRLQSPWLQPECFGFS